MKKACPPCGGAGVVFAEYVWGGKGVGPGGVR